MVPIAIVHHANQYLITYGYKNRTGISEIVGPPDASRGLRAILELHSIYDIPLHLHISGTFLEACAWYEPQFLQEITELHEAGLIEILGSTYAQNIMPLFDEEHNVCQIQEELYLIEKLLNIKPSQVKGFWVPERVWNTASLAKVLKGFRYTFLDDRLFLNKKARQYFDNTNDFIPRLFEAHEIEGGDGLIALPISMKMRLNIPFEKDENQQQLNLLVSQLQQERKKGRNVIAIYGDDMEKSSGIPPWNPNAIAHYEHFLQWLTRKEHVRPVLLSSWIEETPNCLKRPIEPGTYKELAISFGAGENYRGWANSLAWTPYQHMINEAWKHFKSLSASTRQESSLLDLARKHILACTYETGWHDAPNSVHTKHKELKGEESIIGLPAPWARALASHVRSAYVLMEGVKWVQGNQEEQVCSMQKDLDGDGYEEVVLRNQHLAIVITPRFGGRITYAFSYKGKDGALVIGNPSDDWNWLEELNDFMNVPINHPGALADSGFEHDQYEVVSLKTEKDQVKLILVNKEPGSLAYGMSKTFTLLKRESQLTIDYGNIPSVILPLSLEIGYSPDYLRLLREGQTAMAHFDDGEKKGFYNGEIFTWAKPLTKGVKWHFPRCAFFGHGGCIAFSIHNQEGSFCLGIDRKDKSN